MKGPRFFSEALAEYEDAAVYYEKQAPGPVTAWFACLTRRWH
jgi:hypothetical protein